MIGLNTACNSAVGLAVSCRFIAVAQLVTLIGSDLFRAQTPENGLTAPGRVFKHVVLPYPLICCLNRQAVQRIAHLRLVVKIHLRRRFR